MNKMIAAFLAGLIFGMGLIVAQMTNPGKVIGFLDVTGSWDPSLMLVMAGGLVTFGIAYSRSRSQTAPLLSSVFVRPKARVITRPLIVGSVVFGIGWGLGGFCPGPAVVSGGFGEHRAWVFLLAMVAGIFLYRVVGRTQAFGGDAVAAAD